jgi:hypothetical protein
VQSGAATWVTVPELSFQLVTGLPGNPVPVSVTRTVYVPGVLVVNEATLPGFAAPTGTVHVYAGAIAFVVAVMTADPPTQISALLTLTDGAIKNGHVRSPQHLELVEGYEAQS